MHPFADRIWNRWRRHCRSSCQPVMILLYHRVARLQRDPWSMAVTPEQFESLALEDFGKAVPIP